MQATRRPDIDWLRVLAVYLYLVAGFLLACHPMLERLVRRVDVVELVQICKVLKADPVEIMREAELID